MDTISEYWQIILNAISQYWWIILLAAFLVSIVRYIFERKRTRTLELIANSMGLSFRRRDWLPSDVETAGFHLFSQGFARIQDLMYSEANDISLSLFEYSSGGGRGGETYQQTVALFCSESINLPNFDLRPEHIFHKIGSALGYQDIDFEYHSLFSSSYLLRGQDENAIRRIFTDDILTFFSNNTDLSVEARGNKLIVYRHAKLVNPDELPSFLHEARSIFDLFRESQDR